jgi:hypothetical protein
MICNLNGCKITAVTTNHILIYTINKNYSQFSTLLEKGADIKLCMQGKECKVLSTG